MAESARVGYVDVHVLLDIAPPPFEPNAFFPDVPLEAWEPYKEHLNPQGKFQTNFCGFLVRSSGRIVLVDTGLGAGPHERFGGAAGQYVEAMKRHGVKPEDVDIVLHTHLHGDHVGWNLTKVGGVPKPTFPKARYLFPKGDYEFFSKPENAAGAPQLANVTPLLEMGRGELVGPDHNVTADLKTVASPGHTPGHLCVLISSQGRTGAIVGDLFHSSAQVTETEWCPRADMDKPTARKSRAAFLERFEREKSTVLAGHVKFGRSVGLVVREGTRRYWKAL